jgi:erythromycin esterase-like protein
MAGMAFGADHSDDAEVSEHMSRLAQRLCDHEIVMLGEARSHASAATVAAKAALARALIVHCGFSGVLFESAIYDFLHLEHARSRGTVPKTDLRGAIGGLWGDVPEFQPLLELLQAGADLDRIRIGGIDVQPGSATARYAMDNLAADLSSVLPEDDVDRCRTVIGRHHRWAYSRESPFDAAERARLTACIEAVAARASAVDDPGLVKLLPAMAASHLAYLHMLDEVPGARSMGMARNVAWYRNHWPVGTRILIWTATVHAVHPPPIANAAPSLGARLREHWGQRVASVGFSAFAGSHGRGGTNAVIDPAPPDSLEALAMSGDDRAIAVLDVAALRAAGARPSRVLHPAEWHSTDWSAMLDAIVVLREERPMTSPQSPPR